MEKNKMLINEARKIAGYIFHLILKAEGCDASMELHKALDAIYYFIRSIESQTSPAGDKTEEK